MERQHISEGIYEPIGEHPQPTHEVLEWWKIPFDWEKGVDC